MKRPRPLSTAAFALALLALPLAAQMPETMNYQGRVAVAGVNFSGAGQFKFALVNADGSASFWSNDGTSTVGDEPATSVALTVTNGLYSVALADPVLGMTAFDPEIFYTALSLRVWFDDGVHGFQLLTPDQPFGTVPTAFQARLALNVPPGSIDSAQLADGAITSGKLAAGSVAIDQLNFTGTPNTGQVLGFDGANLTWLTPDGGGGPGGGSLTLPFSGLQGATGALFSINNTGAGADSWGIYGHSQTSLGVFGQTHANAHAGVLGRNDGTTGAGGAGVFGYSSTGAFGVLGISEQGDGLWAATNGVGKSAVYGQTTINSSTAATFNHFGTGTAVRASAGAGAGVYATSASYYGVYGQSNGAGSAGVHGFTSAANAAGVHGSSGGTGPAVYAFGTFGGAVGLSAIAFTNDGIDATTAAAGKSAVYAHTDAADAHGVYAASGQHFGITAVTGSSAKSAGFFWNSAGGDAIRTAGHADIGGNATVHGTATVRALTISNGVDVAEPFAMRGDAEFSKGSVLVISDERPGELQLSHEEYDTRVAGIISGANGINPGLQLTQKGVNDIGGQPVALTGRVYCRADATFGAIKPGDLLTTSTNPGHARRVTDHTRAQGAVLGKAMSALEDGTGFVLVLVTLQ